ncbi:hypothetical protein [Bradyrhizobium sp. 145]|uniref:hypothetical protein n=1 Tax=Bradyrhizobium sp. 145 TaxID=2782621 RepID=UPI001FF88DDC|nr:hypothetical protein [Bradyrhizobium sp. 145]MCK1691067.1 hypothetical protein [Bradyrhizobium sp. 145]
MSEIMTDLLRARRRRRRSMVEDQLRHQTHKGRLRFRRQLRPCRRADGAVRQAAPEQIRESLWMRQKAGQLMAFDPSAAAAALVDCVGIRSLALPSGLT